MGLRLVWRDKVRDVIYSNVQREREKKGLREQRGCDTRLKCEQGEYLRLGQHTV